MSIGARPSRPGRGMRHAKTRSSHARAPLPGDLVFAVVGRLVDSDRASALPGIRRARREMPRSGDRSASRAARHPCGANHSACSSPKFAPITAPAATQSVVDRRAAHRARGRQFFVGIAESKAARVILGHLDGGVLRRRERSEARDVHREDVLPRIVVRHPARQHEADAAALAEACHHRAGDPVVAQAPDRSDQRIAVRRESEGAVDRFADADASERRKMLEADFEVGREPLEILRQQLHREIVRRLDGRPENAIRLVRADQRAAALLPHVDLAGVVGGVDESPSRSPSRSGRSSVIR